MYVSNFLLIGTLVAILIRFVRLARMGRVHLGIISFIVGLFYFLALWLPGQLQAAGIIIGKGFLQGVVSLPTSQTIADLSWRWSVELGLVLGTEIAVVSVWTRSQRRSIRLRQSQARRGGHSSLRVADNVSTPLGNETDRTFIAVSLLTVGLVSLLILPAPDLAQRADSGQGLANLLRSALPIGLSYAAYAGLWRKPKWTLLLVLGVMILILGNVRSPLLLVGVGFVGYFISRRIPFGFRLLSTFLAGVIAFALLASFMSAMRANISRAEGRSTIDVAATTLEDPWSGIYASGVDTLDGYRFSMRVAEFEDAHPYDLLTAFTTFVPRSLWPDKPTDMTVEISEKYLGYGASGQFLSPIGYLTIMSGGYAQALILWCALLGLLVFLIIWLHQSFFVVVVLVTAVRFSLGGAAFDFYYGLTLCMPFVFVLLILNIHKRLGKTAASGDRRCPAPRSH